MKSTTECLWKIGSSVFGQGTQSEENLAFTDINKVLQLFRSRGSWILSLLTVSIVYYGSCTKNSSANTINNMTQMITFASAVFWKAL